MEKIYITAKVPPKQLNSATVEIEIYWPNMIFEFCPRMQIDALRPPLLTYSSKAGIEIS